MHFVFFESHKWSCKNQFLVISFEFVCSYFQEGPILGGIRASTAVSEGIPQI